jgi:hypothetical protein
MERYVTAHPSRSYSLRDLGRKVFDFMKDRYAGKDKELVLDMIRFEWAQIEAFGKRLKASLQIAPIRLPDPPACRGAPVGRILPSRPVDRLTRRLRRHPAFRKVTMRRTIELCHQFNSIECVAFCRSIYAARGYASV